MENFKIHITFSNGGTHIEDHTEETLVSAVTRLLQGPAAVSGIISEVKVVDMMDCTNLWARDGKIIFPTAQDVAAHALRST
jgi:hypothetical protein